MYGCSQSVSYLLSVNVSFNSLHSTIASTFTLPIHRKLGQSYKSGGVTEKFLATPSASLKIATTPSLNYFLIHFKEIPNTILAKVVGYLPLTYPRGQALGSVFHLFSFQLKQGYNSVA